MKNKRIRSAIKDAGLMHWQVADAIGISPYSLSVWLRHELSGERLDRVESAIAQLTLEKGGTTE